MRKNDKKGRQLLFRGKPWWDKNGQKNCQERKVKSVSSSFIFGLYFTLRLLGKGAQKYFNDSRYIDILKVYRWILLLTSSVFFQLITTGKHPDSVRNQIHISTYNSFEFFHGRFKQVKRHGDCVFGKKIISRIPSPPSIFLFFLFLLVSFFISLYFLVLILFYTLKETETKSLIEGAKIYQY